MYNDLVYHLDLCTMAYQLYAQSLLWPFDPFYANLDGKTVGTLGGSSTLKPDFLGRVRMLAANGTDLRLDWYNYQYQKLNPTKNALYYEKKDTWTLFRPQPFANSIKEVFLSAAPPHTPVSKLILPGGPGQMELYCFTGVTGLRSAAPPPSGLESLMGYVLHDRQSHTVHIVFRGTQGGDLLEQKIKEATHPDWASNLTLKVAEAPAVCDGAETKIRENYRLCMDTILPKVKAILDAIAAKDQAVNKLYVTGHSLGGALATYCASALTIGQFGRILRATGAFTNWQWERLELITFSAPAVGNTAFRNALNASVKYRRVWISSDLVVTYDKARIGVASDVYHPGQKIMLPDKGLSYSDRHSLPNVRAHLLEFLIENNLISGAGILPPGATAPAGGPVIDTNWVRRWEKTVLTARFTTAPIRQDDVLQLTTDRQAAKNAIIEYLNVLFQILNDNSALEGNKDKLGEVILAVTQDTDGQDNPDVVAAVAAIPSPDLRAVVGHATNWHRINKLL